MMVTSSADRSCGAESSAAFRYRIILANDTQAVGTKRHELAIAHPSKLYVPKRFRTDHH